MVQEAHTFLSILINFFRVSTKSTRTGTAAQSLNTAQGATVDRKLTSLQTST